MSVPGSDLGTDIGVVDDVLGRFLGSVNGQARPPPPKTPQDVVFHDDTKKSVPIFREKRPRSQKTSNTSLRERL